jgi:DNA-3-methyladenine glycosylase II
MATTDMEVAFERPLNALSSLSGFGRWGDDLIDRFDGRTLVRSISAAPDAPPAAYAADIVPGLTSRLQIAIPGTNASDVHNLIAGTFVASHEALAALTDLAAIDPPIAELARRYPGHVPVLVPDPLHALIRSISAQQVNLRWASTIRARLALRYGVRLDVGDAFVYAIDARALAEATVAELRGLQLTNAKARSVVAVARAARAGELRADELSRMADDELIAHLTRLPGIGRWSAEWYLARTLGRPRVVAGDLGVRKAVGRLYNAGMPSEVDVRRLTEHWDTAATLAQALALHDLALSPGPAPAR